MNTLVVGVVILAGLLAMGLATLVAFRPRPRARVERRTSPKKARADPDDSDIDTLLPSAAWHAVAGPAHASAGPGLQAERHGAGLEHHHLEPHPGHVGAPSEGGHFSGGGDGGAGDGGSGDGGGGDGGGGGD